MSFTSASPILLGRYAKNISLSKCDGHTVPYKSTTPDMFETPLKITNEGEISGISSGERSALVYESNEWYKIKGAHPSDKVYQVEDNPVGGQKKSAAIQELNASNIMTRYGKKKGVVAPLTPVCYFDYEIPFQDETVCASVLTAHGDMRMTGFYGRFSELLSMLYKNGLRNDFIIFNIKEQITNRIGEWLGFWYGSLEDQNMCWGSLLLDMDKPPYFRVFDTNVGLDNIVVYDVGDRIGLSLIDLDRCAVTNERIKKFELHRIRHMLEIFDGATHFLESSNSIESIKHWMIDRWSKSVFNSEVFAKDVKIFDIPFPEEFEIMEYFKSGRKGHAPKPIDKEHFVGPIENSIDLLV